MRRRFPIDDEAHEAFASCLLRSTLLPPFRCKRVTPAQRRANRRRLERAERALDLVLKHNGASVLTDLLDRYSD